MSDIYSNIKNRREAIGMSQTELAEASGYSGKSAIARIESGQLDIPQSKIKAIAKALRLSPAQLFDGDLLSIEEEEKELVRAYREAPEAIQQSVCKLLDIPPAVLGESSSSAG